MEFKEEWSSISTITRPISYDDKVPEGNPKDLGKKDWHNHSSEADARHFKQWRESRPARDGGTRWAGVSIQLRRRLVTEWEEVD